MISVGPSCVMHFNSNASSQGWIYSVTVKTQAVLPAQTHLRGKILLSIHGENASLNDALLASSTFTQDVFHAGGEDLIELRNSTRLGEVKVSSEYFLTSCVDSFYRTTARRSRMAIVAVRHDRDCRRVCALEHLLAHHGDENLSVMQVARLVRTSSLLVFRSIVGLARTPWTSER